MARFCASLDFGAGAKLRGHFSAIALRRRTHGSHPMNCRAQGACSVRSSACSRCALILEGTLPLLVELLFQRSDFNFQGLNSCLEIDYQIQESCWRSFLPSL